MKCEKCGRDNAESHNYCIHCGAVLEHPAVKAVRKRMGFFKRLFIQLIIIILVLAGVVYALSAANIISIHRNGENAYTACLAFVGRERLYLTDNGDIGFSEKKVSDTFPEGAHSLGVRIDDCYYGFGGKPALRIVITKDGDASFKREVVASMPDGGCETDYDINLGDNLMLSAGTYHVHFYVLQYKPGADIDTSLAGEGTELKSIVFTVTQGK